MRRIILVTGTPCVGKTSVSRRLASKIDALHLSLGELVEREGLISGVDKSKGTLIADMDKVSKRVHEIIDSTARDVIVDGHYAVDVVPSKSVHMVFALRRDPKELKVFMENRGFEGSKLWENLAVEILDVCLGDAVSVCGAEKVCEIDVSSKKTEEAMEDILLVLEGKKECRVGIVDWLGKLEEEDQLHDFLKPF